MEDIQFTGSVFDTSRGPERIGAQLSIFAETLTARSSDGSEWRLDLSQADLSRGGASGKMVFVKGSDNQGRQITICCDDRAFDRALKELGATGSESIADWNQSDGKRRSRRRAGCMVIIAVLIALLLSIPTLWNMAVSAGIEALPPSVDQEIGDLAWGQMSPSLTLVEVPELDDALTQMYDRLWPHFGEQPWDIRIFVSDDETINAFAIPGGIIVFHSALIFAAETPEEVAAVLAHEIAHVTHRHSIRRIADSLGIIAVAQVLLGDVSGLVIVAKELMTMAALNNRSQVAEAEADHTAGEVMFAAGMDPQHLGSFFQRLREMFGESPDAFYWMSTHPSHSDRIEAVDQLSRDLIAKNGALAVRPLDIDWPKVQSALAESGASGHSYLKKTEDLVNGN